MRASPIPSEVEIFEPDNRRISKLSDEEAFKLLNARTTVSERGGDPVHQQLCRLWFVNIQHFLGMQSATAGGLLEEFQDSQDMFVANHIFRMVTGQVARFSQARPDVDVIPKTPDIDDQEGAKVGQHFLDHYEDRFNMRRIRREMGFWLANCGTAFIRVDWNPMGGNEIVSYKDPYSGGVLNAEQLPEEARVWLDQNGYAETSREGDIEVEVVPPFQVLVPHVFSNQEQMPWMARTYERSMDWVWDRFPKHAKNLTTDETIANEDGQYWRRLSSLVHRSGGIIPGRPTGSHMDAVEIRELWIPPSGRMPKGAHIIGTRKQLLLNEPHPYAAAGLATPDFNYRFPLTKFVYCPAPGRYWGISLVEHLLGPQREYNRARTQVIQQRDILCSPQWISPKGCELNSTRNEYGDIWEYRSQFGKPELQNPPGLSQAHLETIERALLDMQSIAAQSEASQAQVPEGVRSGVAIRALQEKDTLVMGPTVEDMEDGFKEVYEHLLMLTWKFVDTDKAIRIYGEFRQADVSIFKGSELNGNIFVRITPGSMMPRSKATTMQGLIDMLQAGAIDPVNNQDHAEYFFKGMEIGGFEEMFMDRSLDRRRATIENQMFLRPTVDSVSGGPQAYPAVNDDDDHEAHLREHLRFKKTDAFEMLPLMRKLAFEAHCMQHKEAIMAIMQAQVAMQSGPAGAGGEAGGGAGSPPKQPGKASQPSPKSGSAQAGEQANASR